MISVTFYRQSDGKIVSRSTLRDEGEIALNQPEGCSYVLGDHDQDRVWFPNGERSEIPARPDGFCTFDYGSGQWVMNDIAAEASVRKQRNLKLAQCDWTQVPDAPVDQVAWAGYRQALRDIPQQEGFPHNVVWPVKPD